MVKVSAIKRPRQFMAAIFCLQHRWTSISVGANPDGMGLSCQPSSPSRVASCQTARAFLCVGYAVGFSVRLNA